MRLSRLMSGSCLVFFAGMSLPQAHATAINYAPNTSSIQLSARNSSYYQQIGQVFTASAGQDVLNDFSFYSSSGSGSTYYKSYVYQFNALNNSITGASVFTSGYQTVTAGANKTNVGNLSLSDGTTYVAFINAYNDPVSNFYESSAYAPKGIQQYSSLAPYPSESFFRYYTMAFSADFNASTSGVSAGLNDTTAVPEPGFMVGLLGLAFFGLVGFQRRMNSRQA